MPSSTRNEGGKMYDWATELFPICRSLTGDGVRQTLGFFKQLLPDLTLHEIPSGTQVFDWIIPDEWNITDAYVADATGKRIIDFNHNNLHVVGYSEPINRTMSFAELDKHLHSLPEQPDAIPYITSYYQRRWGFCLSEHQRNALRAQPDASYHVCIDSTLQPGNLTYGEWILPGASTKEILLSTYVCHPSMANNELSGPCVAAALAQWLQTLPNRRYTYRIVFLVETIGAIAYLSRHAETLKNTTEAGFILTCMGDDNAYSYVPSRLGNSLADRIAMRVLAHHAPNHIAYSYLDRGSDERQYCSPGIDLPICSVMRSKYGTYPEYHTSLDDLSFISPQGLQGGYDILKHCIEALEENYIYRCTTFCEPQLGKRGLYPTLSTKESGKQVRDMMNFLSYADGKNDLIAIAEKINIPASAAIPLAKKLLESGVVEIIPAK
ncbi:MAG: DUF4910 domain-containing protein [Alphaproteobacteria bacterium]|nr:DUF4910 domain-containing protein [Alphaproteobacteria bacterium]